MEDDNNPYTSPETTQTLEAESSIGELHDPIKVKATDGAQWVVTGAYLFKERWLDWVVVILISFVVMMLAGMGSGILNLIPILGIFISQVLLGAFSAILFAGYLKGTDNIYNGDNFPVDDLFFGFKQNTKNLAIAGAIFNGLILVIMVAVFATILGPMMVEFFTSNNPENLPEPDPIRITLTMLIALALMIPLMMMYWMAPALILFNNVGVIDSFKMSFKGCLINFIPFLIYGIVFTLLGIVAMLIIMAVFAVFSFVSPVLGGLIAFLLGAMVYFGMIATMFGSIYASYRDIYID